MCCVLREQLPKLQLVLEGYRCHPRDPVGRQGRLRVRIRSKEGTPVYKDYSTKGSLLRLCGPKVELTEVRKKREKITAERMLEVEKMQKTIKPGPGTGGASGGKNKKKSKKKR
mmetsp:Transcript_39653/g.64321  ORF Transcript_39653/g.64321 Transcript_39653/m.64321 type:complete len:113 (+) Transcript_39653:298-636(+)